MFATIQECSPVLAHGRLSPLHEIFNLHQGRAWCESVYACKVLYLHL